MRKPCLPVAVLLALSFAAGCNLRLTGKADSTDNAGGAAAALTPQETLVQQAIKLLDRATELMKSVRDRATAAAVAPELKTIAGQLQDLNRRGVPLGNQVQEQPQAAGRFRADLEKAIQRYADVAVRLVAQENLLGTEFQEALRELGKLPQ